MDQSPTDRSSCADDAATAIVLLVFVFEALKNFRDVGGLATADGRQVRVGTLYRSASLDRVTVRDAHVLAQLGIRVACDLRAPDEARHEATARMTASGVTRVNVPVHWQNSQESRRQRLFRVSRPRIQLVVGTHDRFLRAVFADLFQRYGSVENYASEACGVSTSTIDALRRQLLVAK